MQQIPLSQGQFALVDDADYPLLSEFRWCYRPERGGRQGYAVRNTKVGGKRRQCYLHRQLMRPGPGQEVIFLNTATPTTSGRSPRPKPPPRRTRPS